MNVCGRVYEYENTRDVVVVVLIAGEAELKGMTRSKGVHNHVRCTRVTDGKILERSYIVGYALDTYISCRLCKRNGGYLCAVLESYLRVVGACVVEVRTDWDGNNRVGRG